MARSKTPADNALATADGEGKAPVNRVADALGDAGQIVIQPVQKEVMVIEIAGTTPLLVCRWSEKARREILDKQMKRAKKAKEAKNPEEDYNNSRYRSTEGWDGVPAGGVKGCLVNACRAVDGLPMTVAKRIIRVLSDGMTEGGQELVKIIGEPKLHEGMVRIDGGKADIRFRAIYWPWSMRVNVRYIKNMISSEQIANLVELAGEVEGLCEHRVGSPKSNTGSNGCFEVRRKWIEGSAVEVSGS